MKRLFMLVVVGALATATLGLAKAPQPVTQQEVDQAINARLHEMLVQLNARSQMQQSR